MNFSFVGSASKSEGRQVVREMVERGYQQPAELGHGFIPEKDYDRLVGAAHLLLAPIPQRTRKGLVLGEDRAFGVTFSTIRFGKPMLLPRWTPMAEEFEDSIVRYDDDDDLIRKITHFLESPSSLEVVMKRALENARHFTPERGHFAEELLALEKDGSRE